METLSASWSLKLEVPCLQTAGHSANHFVKTCFLRLQSVVKNPNYSGHPVASKVALAVKNRLAMQDTPEWWVQFLDQEDLPEEGREPIPVFFPGESPLAKEPGGLQFMGWQRVRLGTLKARNLWQEFWEQSFAGTQGPQVIPAKHAFPTTPPPRAQAEAVEGHTHPRKSPSPGKQPSKLSFSKFPP